MPNVMGQMPYFRPSFTPVKEGAFELSLNLAASPRGEAECLLVGP
jgi:hypothetical protein